MKNIFFIFIFLVYHFANGQQIVVNEVAFSNGVKSIHLIDSCKALNEKYFFDRKGRKVKMLNNGNESGRTVYTYDDNDNLIEEAHFRQDTVFVQLLSIYQGKDILSTKEIVGRVTKVEEIYTHNDGKLTGLKQFYKGELANSNEYSYDGSQREITSFDEKRVVTGRTKEYEDNNKKVSEHESLNQDYPSYNSTSEKKDAKGNIIETTSLWLGKNEGKTISTYVDDSVLSTRKTFNSEKLTQEIFYDQKGNMIRVNEYFDIKREFDIKNTYNKIGDLVEVQVYEKGKLICDIKYAVEYW